MRPGLIENSDGKQQHIRLFNTMLVQAFVPHSI